MAEGFPGSTQKELIDAKRPLAAKYASLFVGRKGFWALLKYELIQMFIAPAPGALGLWLRKIFYPRIMKKVGRGVVFGRNVVQAKYPERFLDALKQVVKAGMAPDKAAKEFGLS